MFKRMLQFSGNENEEIQTNRAGSTSHPSNVVKLSNALQRESEKAGNAAASKGASVALESFDEVYAAAGIKAPACPFMLPVSDRST